MADKRISELPQATAFTGPELIEIVQGGVNKKGDIEMIHTFIGEGITREFDRTWSSELLFDKNEIDYAEHTQAAAINFTVADGGHLEDQFAYAVQRIVADGVNPWTFEGFQFVSNIANGEVLEAGTYQIFFFYRNGIASASLQLPSLEAFGLETLSAPANFDAVVDSDTEIDLSWDAVANAVIYELQYSLTGGSGPWITIPGIGSATTYSHTGLSAGTTYHYRVRAVGDLEAYGYSTYSVTATTTTSGADSDAPVATFTPANSVTDIPINRQVIIDFDEAIIDDDGVTVITNANVADYLTIKVTDGAGADIPFTATINAGKNQIIAVPAAGADFIWGVEIDVYVAVDGIEDANGNEASLQSATFSTNDFTEANGNTLNFGNILTSLISADNANFEYIVTADEWLLSGTRTLWRKYQSNSRSFLYQYNGAGDVMFKWYGTGGADSSARTREVVWLGVLNSGLHTLRLHYKGAVDTNNGLDRVDLYIDGVLQGSKSLLTDDGGAGDAWPFNIRTSVADLVSGPGFALLKDLQLLSANGTVTEISVPVVRTGEDVSGNNRDGVWE